MSSNERGHIRVQRPLRAAPEMTLYMLHLAREKFKWRAYIYNWQAAEFSLQRGADEWMTAYFALLLVIFRCLLRRRPSLAWQNDGACITYGTGTRRRKTVKKIWKNKIFKKEHFIISLVLTLWSGIQSGHSNNGQVGRAGTVLDVKWVQKAYYGSYRIDGGSGFYKIW